MTDVSQLSGGIHAYQEAFPDGGYFRGKNFVFDPRIVVPSIMNSTDVIGTCCVCSKLYDDYSRQSRCCICRILILVCDDCAASTEQESDESGSCGSSDQNSTSLFCEQCTCDAAVLVTKVK